MVLDVTADRVGLFLRLKDHNLSRENLKRKVSEQDAILKAMIASVKHLKKGELGTECKNNAGENQWEPTEWV